MKDVYIQQSDFSERVFFTDTSAFSSDCDDKAQRTENLRACAKRIGERIYEHGHKLYVLGDGSNESGELASALRRVLTVTSEITEDSRCVLAIGNAALVNRAKEVCFNQALPLFVWWKAPDGDSVLSPFFKQKRNGIPTITPCALPQAVYIDLAAKPDRSEIQRGAGLVAKSILTLAEMQGNQEYQKPLAQAIRECMLVDFSSPTSLMPLFTSLLKISLLRAPENQMLLGSADSLTDSLELFGVNGDDYAFTCSRLLAELYKALSEEKGSFALPPDNISRIKLLSCLQLSPLPYEASEGCETDLFTEKVSEASRGLGLFEAFCGKKLPLPKSKLKELLVLASTLYKRRGALRAMYLEGLLG